ncbi:Uncharacterised protein [Vibrio cholerae]|nr:Uncharacterised protein [Vibrio cholerae]
MFIFILLSSMIVYLSLKTYDVYSKEKSICVKNVIALILTTITFFIHIHIFRNDFQVFDSMNELIINVLYVSLSGLFIYGTVNLSKKHIKRILNI